MLNLFRQNCTTNHAQAPADKPVTSRRAASIQVIPGSWQRGLSRSDLSDLLQLPEGPGSEGTRQPCNAVATAMPQMASCLRSSLTKVYIPSQKVWHHAPKHLYLRVEIQRQCATTCVADPGKSEHLASGDSARPSKPTQCHPVQPKTRLPNGRAKKGTAKRSHASKSTHMHIQILNSHGSQATACWPLPETKTSFKMSCIYPNTVQSYHSRMLPTITASNLVKMPLECD